MYVHIHSEHKHLMLRALLVYTSHRRAHAQIHECTHMPIGWRMTKTLGVSMLVLYVVFVTQSLLRYFLI